MSNLHPDRSQRAHRAVAVVGVGAILPDAPTAPAFWENLLARRDSISETPAERWSLADYWDPDPAAPDKTYSKLGGWVRGYSFDWKRWHVPPRVAASMDEGQQWSVTIGAEALEDWGWPRRSLDLDRTGIVLGAAMGGELHYRTAFRIFFPEVVRALEGVPEFGALPGPAKEAILAGWRKSFGGAMPPVTEDTMPGELANIMAGRVANILNLRGPSFTADAACASTFAAVDAAVHLLLEGHCDSILTGGVDRNMGPTSFVKFSKIGALSATGSRPFGEGADGFVMGEGGALFLLRRLEDAERDGDRIYCVIRGVGASSDGKGKGITAPNPVGQKLAIERAWRDAGLDPATAGMVEAHGTSTKVGDVVEVESLATVFSGAPRGSIAIGSAKGNVGHLKAGAGAAGMLKAILAIHHRTIPPTLHAERPNPAIDFPSTPFYPATEAREWRRRDGLPLRCGVSAYGFGGTNFHAVLEEHVPGALASERERAARVAVPATYPASPVAAAPATAGPTASTKVPPRGVAVASGADVAELKASLSRLLARARDGALPAPARPTPAELSASERLVVDFGDGAELVERLGKAEKVLAIDTPAAWKSLAAQGVFRGSGRPEGKVAFVFPGQGSQYVNMGRELAALEPIVARTYAEADAVLTPALGRSLTSLVFLDPASDEEKLAAEKALMQTKVTQPAVLSIDVALAHLLGEYGFSPDIVLGHSLGEYGALVAAEVLPFGQALQAAAARGREMEAVSLADNGQMAAVIAPIEVVEETLETVRATEGYVVAANINSRAQCVIGGETKAVEKAVRAFRKKGITSMRIPVSHAFHTRIVGPASGPLRRVLDRFDVFAPRIPVVANVTADLYPNDVDGIKSLLERQIASPVQWVRSLEKAWDEGARTFVEVGPKKALKGFVDDVLGDREGLVSLATNHPKPGEVQVFGHALCGLWAAGHGAPEAGAVFSSSSTLSAPSASSSPSSPQGEVPPGGPVSQPPTVDSVTQLLSQALARLGPSGGDRNAPPAGSVVISGTGLGLPGAEKQVMDPANAERILRGEQFVDLIPERFRRKMAAKNVTRVVKDEDGSGRFETIVDTADVIKLAGRPGSFDLEAEYGVSAKLVEALDVTTQLALAAGLDALREAGIPLVQSWKPTTTGKHLPDRWMLPEALRDETGVIFACAFPGYDRFADEMERYYAHESLRSELAGLEDLRRYVREAATLAELDRRIGELKERTSREPYVFDRRFLFRILSMGHSQFAEYVGARGPNTQVNSACASTAQAIALAEDWIRGGRCRRVVVLGADDVTGDRMIEWIGAGFLASGAAATDDKVEEAALPFDRRRHGTIMGMGACALVLEAQDAVEERGMRGIVELLATETRNSAFHGTRLDVDHIALVMESLVTSAERRFGISRQAIAPATVFMSHETFTPARGGSAAAEVAALRRTFGPSADAIVVANTKGFTGHPMGVGIEDVIAVKILEHGIVPPVPNYREVDPDLGTVNLSRGGRYPVLYAIHLAAGFGSQISFTLTRRIPGGPDRLDERARHEKWLADVTGEDRPSTEVVKRVLRLKGSGAPPLRPPAASPWRFGAPPSRRAPSPGDGAAVGYAPMPMPAPGPAVSAQAPRPAEARAASGPAVSAAPEPPHPSAPAALAGPAPVSLAAPPPAAEPAGPSVDPVAARVLAIVAETTGYPPEMLDMELDLEADLGIDTVKQAEVFAAVREEWAIARQENLRLRDFPTLRHVVGFVYEFRPDLEVPAPAASTSPAAPAAPGAPAAPVLPAAGAAPAASPRAAAPAPAAAADPVPARVLAIVAEKTGYPPEMLEMELDLEADLGVDTVKQAEVFAAVREEWGIARQENLKLRDFPTLKHVVQFVYDARPDLVPPPTGPAPGGAPVPTAPAAGPASPPAPAPVPASSPAGPADAVAQRVLAIVAEKTGYPPEMLEMELDLEADLGVDTVKQAEVFAAVREEWAIARQESLKLRDFPTLKHVVRFVYDFRPDLASAAAAASVAPAASAGPAVPAAHFPERRKARAGARGLADLAAADTIARRVVVPVLRPPLALCRPTGVRLEAGTRVVVGGAGPWAEALDAALASRGVLVLRVDPSAPQAALEEELRSSLSRGPVHGVFWLPALEDGSDLLALDLPAFREANRRNVKSLAAAMRVLYDAVGGPGTFLSAATRLGGLHGYGPDGAFSPLGGAVTGFVKAWKREKPEALAKAVDFAAGESPAEVAAALVAETLADPGCVEVGLLRPARGLAHERWAVSFEERPVPVHAGEGARSILLGKETVALVTGAAGGITSAIVADLAAASGGTFYLLDIAAAPRPSDPKIALLRSGRDVLQRALIAEARERGEKPTPVQVDRQVMAVEREEAALAAVEAVEAAGGTAHWRSVNLLDGPALAGVVDEIRARHGRIDVLVHAGGLEISRRLPDKDAAEFDLVFDVKADGFFSILKAAGSMPLGAAVVFSSVAGRFGNAGQTDYSAANDLLCKTISWLRAARPGTTAVALDWTAWGGIGMATRGSIPKIMEAAGIDMLPPEAGIPTVRRELLADGTGDEIVVAGRLGTMGRELEEDGGLDVEAAARHLASLPRPLVTVGRPLAWTLHGGLEVETTLDPGVQPFLFDHAMEGTPLLPGVMGTETFAELASFAAPGRAVLSVEEESFEKAFKFFRMQPQTLHLRGRATRSASGDVVVSATLFSEARPKPELPPQRKVHFRASVRMGEGAPLASRVDFRRPEPSDLSIGRDAIYEVYFHGPAYRVLDAVAVSADGAVGLMAEGLPPNAVPEAAESLVAPRLLELCFQTAGLWEVSALERLALPSSLARVRPLRDPSEANGRRLWAVVAVRGGGDSFDARVVDDEGAVYLDLEGYRTVALPGRVALAGGAAPAEAPEIARP